MAKEAMPAVMEVMWNMTALDVEKTLKAVCVHVLDDEVQTMEARIMRAEGLLKLGQTFTAAATAASGGSAEQIKERHMAAMKEMGGMATGGGEWTGGAPGADEEEAARVAANPTAAELKEKSIKELKTMLTQGGVDYSDCVEKNDLVKRLLTSYDEDLRQDASGKQ